MCDEGRGSAATEAVVTEHGAVVHSSSEPVKSSCDVTLVIPSYLGAEWIRPCLESVKAQILDRGRFEVLVVVNGPVDSVPELVAETFDEPGGVNYRIIFQEKATLSGARNTGIREARGRGVTFLDVDDWISPNFLEALVAAAEPGVVPLATVEDVEENTGRHLGSAIADSIREAPRGINDPVDLHRPLGFAVCKLLPIDVARRLEFDEDLRSGEDVAYYPVLFHDFDLKLSTDPAHAGATYFRMMREGSMSRQAMSFDFAVDQRLKVIRHLDRTLQGSNKPMAAVVRTMLHSQALFTKRYLAQNPEEIQRVIDAVEAADLSYYPWHLLNTGSDRLAVCFNFVPYADASSVVALKRIIESGARWNVISNDMSSVRSADHDLYQRARIFFGHHETVDAPNVFTSWAAIEEFCEKGWAAFLKLEEENGPQKRLYSRSMWPASHFLAALIKLRRPDCEWEAEFSDPIAFDVAGVLRPGAVTDGAASAELKRALRERGFPAEPVTLFKFAEDVVFSLADSVMFTNVHQMNYMLDYGVEPRHREAVEDKAVVAAHPRTPRWLLSAESAAAEPRTRKAGMPVTIGYFGSFYANRGAGTVLKQFAALPKTAKNCLRFSFYTDQKDDLLRAIRELRLEDWVEVHGTVPYLQYLGQIARHDVLLVIDADSRSHGLLLNPFLPSKYAEYASAGKLIWGVVERGSILSGSRLDFASDLHDDSSVRAVLTRLAEVSL
ncbi:glycosyltransferase [Brevibacterium otitidis]|uniref:Glycosyltransferase n=1 Tax=Brevibacterium otitidis TaxID=53364 RepID=A0ABV5X6Q0_9MICO|nr:hypothetical protein GCM10023233_01520 [Brevibacterium otitidis]